jgi:hypothetical protein
MDLATPGALEHARQCITSGASLASTASQRGLQIAAAPLSVDKVRDIVGPCFDSTELGLVFCVDEKS